MALFEFAAKTEAVGASHLTKALGSTEQNGGAIRLGREEQQKNAEGTSKLEGGGIETQH